MAIIWRLPDAGGSCLGLIIPRIRIPAMTEVEAALLFLFVCTAALLLCLRVISV